MIELLQSPARQTGLVVFTSYDSYHTWLVQSCLLISRSQCHYKTVDMYWQHFDTGNKLQLVIINSDKDLFKLAGYLFDGIWFVDELPERRHKAVLARGRMVKQ